MDINNDIIKKKVAIEIKAENNFRRIVLIYFKSKFQKFKNKWNSRIYRFSNRKINVYRRI